MERHAVPQNIMDVEFKLFGSLTVRQFTSLAVAFIIALLIYFSGLPQIITIPVVIFVVAVGLGMAFLTVNGMPFGRWFNNFVGSLLSQQRKIYHKTATAPQALTENYQRAKPLEVANPLDAKREAVRAALDARTEGPIEYKQLPDQGKQLPDIFDDQNNLENYFNKAAVNSAGKYNLKLEERPLNTKPQAAEAIIPRPPGNAQVKPRPTLQQAAPVITQPAVEPAGVTSKFNIVPQQVSSAPQRLVEPVAAPPAVESARAPVEPLVQPQPVSQQVTAIEPESEDIPLELTLHNQLKPNQLAGFIADKAGSPLDKAEVMVKDGADNLLRSVYTDLKGKFIIPSVLPDGEYSLEVKKDGFEFPDFPLKLTGEVVPVYKYLASN